MDSEKLIVDNMDLACKIGRKWAGLVPGSRYEDMIGICMIGLINAARTFKEKKGKFSTYAGICMDNEVRMTLRGKKVEEVLGSDMTMVNHDEEESSYFDNIPDDITPEDWENRIVLERAMENLSPDERKVIVMKYYEGITQIDIAAALGCSRAEAYRIEQRALDKMRKHVA